MPKKKPAPRRSRVTAQTVLRAVRTALPAAAAITTALATKSKHVKTAGLVLTAASAALPTDVPTPSDADLIEKLRAIHAEIDATAEPPLALYHKLYYTVGLLLERRR